MDSIDRCSVSLWDFQNWLEITGRGHLSDGVGAMPIGDALLEIYRRAGVRGIKSSDSIVETLPLARDIIALRVKPRFA